MVQAESSTSASRNGLKAVTAGAPPDYELPWYVPSLRFVRLHLTSTYL